LQTGAGFWADAKAGIKSINASWIAFIGWDSGWVKIIKVNVTEKGTSSLFCAQRGYSRQNVGEKQPCYKWQFDEAMKVFFIKPKENKASK